MRHNEIIGYSKFKSKAGNEVMFVDVVKHPTDRDISFGRVGMKVEQIWIPSSCFNKFSPAVVGKLLKASYEVDGMRANVVDVDFE